MNEKRLLMMITGAGIILFTGFPHIWSIYQPYVMEETGWGTGTVSLCFYLPTLFFVVGNVIGGRIGDTKSPKAALIPGGILISAGVFFSGLFMGTHPMSVYLTFGVMQGLGEGIIYAVVLSIAQKWFQDRTGFASGVVITANGFCGFLMSPISKMLLQRGGSKLALTVIGMSIGVAALLAVIFVRRPKEFQKTGGNDTIYGNVKQYSSMEMVRTKKFYYLVITMMCGLMAYYLISPISQTLQIGRGIKETIAIASVMAGSVINAGMRLILPSMADYIGRIKCIQGVLIASVIVMVFFLTGSKGLSTIAVVMAYGCFGGIMGSFPSLASSIFSLKYSGQNYGIIMSGIIIANIISPVISNVAETVGASVNLIFLIGMLCSLIAFVFSIKLDKEIKQEVNQKKGV